MRGGRIAAPIRWGRRTLRTGRQGQRTPEGGAVPRRALDADLAAVALDDGLADMEAQPQADARSTPHLDIRGAVELLPDALALIGRQPRPAITYLNPHALRAIQRHAHVHRLIHRRVFERVRQEVGDRLLDAIGVGEEHDLRSLWQLHVD